ncbi:leucyl aminopeptidase [Candidatus Pelagibacter ubique]|uniref:Probable cytosol aminopeptidase n=1 Tax=Pelagibacter ubique TaxID=198252 RepID=A0ABX1T0E3_PELUQ|nr:leucyl aminopeptidase [Candidatus Pelagibacter ubique]NMN66909.1 leucyl aminopeptidase [Candidatus Pelagibacter ubique]
MSIKISYLNNLSNKTSANLVLFTDEKFNITSLKKYISNTEFSYISDLLITSDLKKNLLFFEINSKKTIFLISIKKDLNTSDIESLGAKFHGHINYDKKNDYFVNSDTINSKIENFVGYFLHGLKLKSYEFNIYKSVKNKRVISVKVIGSKNKISAQNKLRFKALEEGTFFARDLVSEPGNILHPDEYAKRLNSLRKYGLKINIYDDKKLQKLGMNALLGVGQGSIRGSYLVTMEWNGVKNNSKPVAFVGKGVCFDTGGISLKPAKFMEDMTYDMAGSATVVGLMKNLALRKAKINAVGVVGLVENMPGGNAQRPGDIVKSYSGKTIEILNTDAEGRLVLADALTFTEKKFKPKFIVDLATLTGAIIVSLGSEYAGLFSNDEKLSKQLLNAGEKVDEKLWRMPLHKNFDKLIDSKNADMQNINYVGGAGSTTAAQFLQRFILKETPWAHLDIAGMAFSKYGGALNSGGATGYGVRLLNKLIEDNYE